MSEPTKEQIAEVFNSLMSTAHMYEGIYGSPRKMIIKVISYWVRCSKELVEANEYADRLVEHKDMVCLPADLANLRKANAAFASENEALKKEIKDLRDLLIFGK